MSDLDLVINQDYEEEGEARLFFVNFTSSLLPVNGTLLLWLTIGLLGLAGVGYLLYLLATRPSGGNTGYGNSYGGSSGYDDDYKRYRNRRDVEDDDWIKVLSLLDVGTELYSDVTNRDLKNKCYDKLICEVLEDRYVYGAGVSFLKMIYELIGHQDIESNTIKVDEEKPCSNRFLDCKLSLRKALESRRNAREEFV